MLQVIYPLTYWDAIRRHSASHGLDPYLVAALIAQESTFDPDIKSVANAWGLMQLVPATGRRLAKSVGIRNFTTASLTNPEMNIRLGTLYFSRLVEQFGGTYYALASYNAGESRIVRWKAERPGLDEDEFIDDIPFPETQNYVKRILGYCRGLPAAVRFGRRHAGPPRRLLSGPRQSVRTETRVEESARVEEEDASEEEKGAGEAFFVEGLSPLNVALALAPSGERDDFEQRHVGIARELAQVPAERLEPLADLAGTRPVHIPVHPDIAHATALQHGEAVVRRE